MYTLKPPLEINCSQCQTKVVISFSPPRQHYSQKNNWGYWTEQKKNQNEYICDACLIDIYRNHKQTYLDSITNSKKRRTFRGYFGGSKNILLTKSQQKQIKVRSLHEILRKKGINLDDEDKIGEQLESWLQTLLKAVAENALKDKKIRELEKKLVKKPKTT